MGEFFSGGSFWQNEMPETFLERDPNTYFFLGFFLNFQISYFSKIIQKVIIKKHFRNNNQLMQNVQKQPVIVVLQGIYSKNTSRTNIQTLVINTCFLQIYFNSLRPYHNNFLDFPTKAALSDCFKIWLIATKMGTLDFCVKAFQSLIHQCLLLEICRRTTYSDRVL